ncbi:MAG: NYN domain-containing protein, partial [Aquabacterium sp.]|nr:NYN domain-containing protein [Aquabacterium sp.]
DTKVAVLVDCENADPDILDYALRVAAQFGRVVLRRGLGSHTALANKWQTVLAQQAFTPCLQYAYAAGKNTSDIALAIDANEALFDQRATTFCLVTSDSDFAGLCRKLRERGATVPVIGEAKTPEALLNASDQFFQWVPPEAAQPADASPQPAKPPAPPKPKLRPKSVVSAVKLVAAE